MTVRYLLDTSVCANVLKRLDEGVMRRLAALPVAEVGVSAITHSEIVAGAMLSRREAEDREAVDLFFRHVAVMPYLAEAAEQYAAIQHALTWMGGALEPHELLVAAHAHCLRLTLVTCDGRRFGRVPGLAVEDWGRG